MSSLDPSSPLPSEEKPCWQTDLRLHMGRTDRKGAVRGWFLSPGFRLVTLHRWSCMYQQGSKLRRYLGELIWRWGVAQFGCYLSPLSRIGARLFLPHPTGIVVGEGVIIGKGVTIYQHVTIGKARPEDKAYPVIEDDVILYAGVVIVGDTRVGRGSIIGANAVVLSDVPPFVVAAGSPAKVIKLLRPVL